MQQNNPEGWESVKELLRDTPVWNAVLNDPHYANIKDNEDEVTNEALSSISGKQNAARMEAEAREMLDDAVSYQTIYGDVDSIKAWIEDYASKHGGKKSLKNVQFSIGTDITQNQSPAEQLTTQAVLTALDKANVPVVVVSKDMVNDMLAHFNGDIEMMGSNVNNRMARIREYFEGKDLSKQNRKLVDIFSGKTKKCVISLKDKNGKTRNLLIEYGNDEKAGARHVLYRHYDVPSNYIYEEELFHIPTLIEQGKRSQKGNRVNYELRIDGVRFGLTTEIKGNKENLITFKVDRKKGTDSDENNIAEDSISKGIRGTRSQLSPEGNTELTAVTTSDSVSDAKIDNNSETGNGISKLSSDGVVYGWTDGKTIYLN